MSDDIIGQTLLTFVMCVLYPLMSLVDTKHTPHTSVDLVIDIVKITIRATYNCIQHEQQYWIL